MHVPVTLGHSWREAGPDRRLDKRFCEVLEEDLQYEEEESIQVRVVSCPSSTLPGSLVCAARCQADLAGNWDLGVASFR
jgi:hypothetical protein